MLLPKTKIAEAKQTSKIPCRCLLKCFKKVSEDQGQKLFDAFWASADLNTQNAHICSCNIKRKYTNKGAASQWSNSRIYYVHNGAGV